MTPQDQDWTELIGLRRAVVAMVLRSLVGVVVWCGILYLCMPLVNAAPGLFKGRGVVVGFVVIGVPAGLVGMFIGWFMTRRMLDIAGMTTPLITLIALIIAWASIYYGTQLVWVWRPSTVWWSGGIAWLGAGIFATSWIIKTTMLDE